jgi:hypothetical protein
MLNKNPPLKPTLRSTSTALPLLRYRSRTASRAECDIRTNPDRRNCKDRSPGNRPMRYPNSRPKSSCPNSANTAPESSPDSPARIPTRKTPPASDTTTYNAQSPAASPAPAPPRDLVTRRTYSKRIGQSSIDERLPPPCKGEAAIERTTTSAVRMKLHVQTPPPG